MLRRRHFFGGVLFALAMLGCARTTPATDTRADEQAINAVREREVAGFNAGAVDSTLAVFAPNAVLMPPNEPSRTGHDALREWFQNMASQFSISGSYPEAEVTIAGDRAIERFVGRYTLTPKAGGQPVELRFKGIHIYQRQPDGKWLIVQDVWNSDVPCPAQPSAR
jgi:ketosteroid isomerase-like protein